MSVLDIGCAEGFFCIEAKKRNAETVLGLDFDPDKVQMAKKISEILNLEINYTNGDLENIETLGNFDYIICLNIIHHLTDPIAVIEKLINMTNKKLVLEIADIKTSFSDIGKRKKNKALLGWWRYLLNLIPSQMLPSIMVVDTRARFLITKKWIYNLLKTQYPDIKNINFLDSELKHRFIVEAHVNDINSLTIVSGPTNIGKSEMLSRFKSEDSKITELLNADNNNNLKVLSAASLQKNPHQDINNLLLEYDFYRTILRRYGKHNYDPSLRIIKRAKDKTVYVLVCSVDELKKRVSNSMQMKGILKKKDYKKLRRMIFEYSDPKRVQQMYKDWISFCRSLNCKINFIDARSRNFSIISEEQAFEIIV